MKKILRNDLWLAMIAWCFFLSDYEILGIFVAICLTLYNCYLVKKINNWRLISTFLMISIFEYLLLVKSNIISIYHFIYPFLVVMTINTALMNEVCYKLKKKALAPTYFSLLAATIVFVITALIIPESPLMPFYKRNLLIFIALIFFPSFVNMSVCLLNKVLKKQPNIEKLYN